MEQQTAQAKKVYFNRNPGKEAAVQSCTVQRIFVSNVTINIWKAVHLQFKQNVLSICVLRHRTNSCPCE